MRRRRRRSRKNAENAGPAPVRLRLAAQLWDRMMKWLEESPECRSGWEHQIGQVRQEHWKEVSGRRMVGQDSDESNLLAQTIWTNYLMREEESKKEQQQIEECVIAYDNREPVLGKVCPIQGSVAPEDEQYEDEEYWSQLPWWLHWEAEAPAYEPEEDEWSEEDDEETYRPEFWTDHTTPQEEEGHTMDWQGEEEYVHEEEEEEEEEGGWQDEDWPEEEEDTLYYHLANRNVEGRK